MPHELKQMFEDWLAHHYPERARHVLNLVRETRAGQLNDPKWHSRFKGTGPYADLLARRFERAARQWGFDRERTELDCSRFAVPERVRDTAKKQMSLF